MTAKSSLQAEVGQERIGFTVTTLDQPKGDPHPILADVFESRVAVQG